MWAVSEDEKESEDDCLGCAWVSGDLFSARKGKTLSALTSLLLSPLLAAAAALNCY